MALGIHVSAANSSGATSVTTATRTTTSGSTIILGVCCFADAFAATPVQDSNGNTWTLIESQLTVASRNTRMYRAVNITGGAGHTFTVNNSASGFAHIFVQEVLSAPAAPTITTTPGVEDAATPYTSSSIAPATANILIAYTVINAGSGTDTHTYGGSFAAGDKQENITDADNFVTGSMAAVVKAAGTYSSSVTSTAGDAAAVWIVAVEESAGGAAYNAVPLLQYYQSLNRGGIFH